MTDLLGHVTFPALVLVLAVLLIAATMWSVFQNLMMTNGLRPGISLTWGLISGPLWTLWRGLARLRRRRSRQRFLSYYGPFALLLRLGVWAALLIAGFALLQWSLGSQFYVPQGTPGLGTDLYVSGTTFFTLGLGDVAPRSELARAVTVLEAGAGFTFLALVIGWYLPLHYQTYARREANIVLLDARAGSPPSAVEMLVRLGQQGHPEAFSQFLEEWERWAGELLEDHLTYPVLAYFHSRHEQQSWLCALTTILDVCVLLLVGVEGLPVQPARVTFAMARHAMADLTQILRAPLSRTAPERLSAQDLDHLRARLRSAGIPLSEGEIADQALKDLRGSYEPYMQALSRRLELDLPRWMPQLGLLED